MVVSSTMATQLSYDPLSKECELIMADALTLFVQAKISDSDLRLDRFLLDYFRKVKLGEHVFQRSYEFISGSDHNKKMFISLFWKTYHHLAFTSEPLTELDYYNLLLLLCPDIPRSLVAAAFMTITIPTDDKLYFPDFIYSFQLCFYFPNFLNAFRDALVFIDPVIARDKIIETASNVIMSLSNMSGQSAANALPPFAAVKTAFAQMEHFDCWKSVQECLIRSDALNNAVGILPLRSTMADHESLRTLIPPDWSSRRSVQPTLLTLTTTMSTSNYDGGSQSDSSRATGMLKNNVNSTLPSNNKLLKRPSKQLKLPQNSGGNQLDTESVFVSEQSSVAENSSTTGSVPGYSNAQRISLRGQRPRLPSITTAITNGLNRMHTSSSVPTNLSCQVVDEQSSSDDEATSSVSSDN